MAEGHWIYCICRHCGGDGYLESTTQAPGEEPVIAQQICPNCNGEKICLWGYMTKDDYILPDEIPGPE